MIESDRNAKLCMLIEAKDKDEVQKIKFGVQLDKIHECALPFTAVFCIHRKSEPNVISGWYSRHKVRVIG